MKYLLKHRMFMLLIFFAFIQLPKFFVKPVPHFLPQCSRKILYSYVFWNIFRVVTKQDLFIGIDC